MNKIALITDTHFGAKNDAKYLLDYFNLFLNDVFFPSLIENNIKTVISLGDLFDRRKYINFYTLDWVKKNFFDRLEKMGIEFYIIGGNHDIFYKNTNSINSLQLLIESYSNVHVYMMKPEHLVIGNTKFLMLPWMNDENREEFFECIDNSDADVLIAHMGLIGFEMVKGVCCTDGYDRKLFQKFKKVLSGHFHLKGQADNITYLGCPWELNFSDCGTPKGFYVFDTDNTELEFYKNPFQLYKRLKYNDKLVTKGQLFNSPDLLPENVAGKHIKLVVEYKKNPKWFDDFVNKIYDAFPLSLNVVESYNTASPDQIEDVDLSLSTMEILSSSLEEYQDNLFDRSHTQRIIEVMDSLYRDAQERD